MNKTDLANFITMSHFNKFVIWHTAVDISYLAKTMKSRAQFNRNHNQNREIYIALFQHPLLTAL